MLKNLGSLIVFFFNGVDIIINCNTSALVTLDKSPVRESSLSSDAMDMRIQDE